MKQETRYIALSDESGMGGELIILQTNAPAKRLKALEKESCEGYECSIIDSHQHVTPYDTSKEWQQEEYPEIKEFYYIDTIEE